MKTAIRLILITTLMAVALTMAVFTAAGFGTRTAADGAAGGLVLGSYDGSVAVFDANDLKTPLQVTEIELASLRAADRALVEQGIALDSGEALTALLEDLGS